MLVCRTETSLTILPPHKPSLGPTPWRMSQDGGGLITEYQEASRPDLIPCKLQSKYYVLGHVTIEERCNPVAPLRHVGGCEVPWHVHLNSIHCGACWESTSSVSELQEKLGQKGYMRTVHASSCKNPMLKGIQRHQMLRRTETDTLPRVCCQETWHSETLCCRVGQEEVGWAHDNHSARVWRSTNGVFPALQPVPSGDHKVRCHCALQSGHVGRVPRPP